MAAKSALLPVLVVAGVAVAALAVYVARPGSQRDPALAAAASGASAPSFDAGQTATSNVSDAENRELAAPATDPRVDSSVPREISPEPTIVGDFDALEEVPSMATILYEDAELRAEFEALLYHHDPDVRSEAQRLLAAWGGDQPGDPSAEPQN